MRNIPTKSKGSAASRLCSCSASTQAPPCATPRADGHGCALGGRRSKIGYLFDLSSLCLSLQRPACALVWYLAETFSAMNTHPWPATWAASCPNDNDLRRLERTWPEELKIRSQLASEASPEKCERATASGSAWWCPRWPRKHEAGTASSHQPQTASSPWRSQREVVLYVEGANSDFGGDYFKTTACGLCCVVEAPLKRGRKKINLCRCKKKVDWGEIKCGFERWDARGERAAPVWDGRKKSFAPSGIRCHGIWTSRWQRYHPD